MSTKLNFKNLNLLIILILPLFFLIFAFREQNQLHEKFVIQGIGVDFEDDIYKLTVQAYDFKNPEKKDEPKIRIVESKGETISEALEKLKKLTGLESLYSQNRIIVFGKDLAQSERGLNVLDFFIRHYENRPSVRLRLAIKTAEEILKTKVNNKPIRASEVADLVDRKSDIILLEFQKNLFSNTSDPILPVLEKNENDVIICESISIFKSGKFVKILDKNETNIVKILTNKPAVGTYNFELEGKKTSCKFDNAKTKIKVELYDEPIFKINTKISINLLETYATDDLKEISTKIESKLKKTLEKDYDNTIRNVLKEKCDIFNFGKILERDKSNYFKKIKKNWKEMLPSLKYDICIEPSVSVLGMKSI
ncbi:MAG: Ger(x)C family spore germination protein [Firmicutes bacterium]|nr:Ger(x)C family spore germination protein [Bacillota bacterium]